MRPGLRVVPEGKFLELGGQPFHVRGVTYGGFKARLDGWEYPDPLRLKQDFAAIAAAGLNTVRTYTVPPPEALDIASELDLRLLVGINYDDWRMETEPGRAGRRRVLESGRRAVAEAMAALAGNSAVLAVSVGNEVPADLVRLFGAGSVADALSRLIADVHDADPHMLTTYVNYPTTEYLEVDSQDLATFNVFLEQPEQLRSYLSHLQVVSGARPLVVTELGLAGDVHGEAAQAEALEWQLRTVDEVGCAGATVFSWTDEWAVNDEAVEGWGFGITTIDREPKPALATVRGWAEREYPSDLRSEWLSITVVVNTYNEERNIEACLNSLMACEYPGLEAIVCDDGSTDRTVELARTYPFEVLALPFIGLAAARNAAVAAASGEIVAFLDADAACHSDWPFHLALSMGDSGISATGGPNLPWPAAGFVERAVAASPGSPTEVLLTDTRAEHVPGCNMAFRRDALEEVGGFDPIFESAGDDVDVCWKLLDAGHEIGFTPSAQVVHHRRASVRGYLKQQRGYGRAERALSGRHRRRFNRLGQARWRGFIYGGSRLLPSVFRPVVYSGYQGAAPFQPVTSRTAEIAGAWASALLPLAGPVAIVGLALGLISLRWLVLPALLVALAFSYAGAIAISAPVDHHDPQPWRVRALVGALHVLQPLARAWGRITGPRRDRRLELRSEEWIADRSAWLRDLGLTLEKLRCAVRPGGPDSAWDLWASSGLVVSARITTAVVWQRDPLYSVSYRPRPFFAVVLAVAVGAGLAGSAWWVAAAGVSGAIAWLAGSSIQLRRRIKVALRHTTEGSKQ